MTLNVDQQLLLRVCRQLAIQTLAAATTPDQPAADLLELLEAM